MANTNMTNVLTGTLPVVKSMPQGLITQICTAAVTTALAAADTLTGPSIPGGAYLWDIILDTTDLDSNGSPTITLSVGIAGTLTKFINASTIGQTGGSVHMNVAGALGYSPTDDTPVIVSVTAAGTTKVAGTVKIGVTYTNSP
jgi:hypothetical protein